MFRGRDILYVEKMSREGKYSVGGMGDAKFSV